MGKLAKPILVGAVVVFFWGMFSWTVLPWHNMTWNSFESSDRVARTIKRFVPKSGIFIYPNHATDKEGHEEMMKKMKEGPFIFASVRKNGVDPSMGKNMLGGFLLNSLVAFILMWLLGQTKRAKYWSKVGFLVAAVFMGAMMVHIPYWLWWGFDLSYTIVMIMDHTIGWTLGSAAMVKVMK